MKQCKPNQNYTKSQMISFMHGSWIAKNDAIPHAYAEWKTIASLPPRKDFKSTFSHHTSLQTAFYPDLPAAFSIKIALYF